MIKKLLNKLFSEKKVECSVDQDSVDCEHLDDDQEKAYTGIPAPILNPVDEWFASPYGCPTAVTEKQKELESQAFKEEAHKYFETKESVGESFTISDCGDSKSFGLTEPRK